MARSPGKRSASRRSLAVIVSLFGIIFSSFCQASPKPPTPVYIACAANFFAPIKELVAYYKNNHVQGARILISTGSSGSLYRQIRHGSPHHLFLSADSFFPTRLEQDNLIITGTRKTYAIGELVLWHPGIPLNSLEDLATSKQTLAIANPKTAPYGKAAKDILNKLNPSAPWQLVTGTSIAQAYQFVASGNVPAGFISRSQINTDSNHIKTIPAEWYRPLIQQMVLTRKAEDQPQAFHFFEFLGSKAAQKIILNSGYRIPPASPQKSIGASKTL